MYKDFSTIGTVATNIPALNQAIKNIILTRKGSVPGIPRFGSDIHKIIFSQIDSVSIELAKRFIFEAIQEWEKRIELNEISIEPVPEYNKLIISIIYSYRDQDTLELVTEKTDFSITQ